jgi:hypothetical protein
MITYKELARRATNITNDRPLSFLSIVGGVRDILIGIGFILGLDEIRQTRLFMNYDALVPGYSGIVVGVILLAVGLLVSVMATTKKIKPTRAGLTAQAFLWLFSTLMYALSGSYLLAVIFGIFFSLPAGYIAYQYKIQLTRSSQAGTL